MTEPEKPPRARSLTAFILCVVVFPIVGVATYAILCHFHALPDLQYDTEEGAREIIWVASFVAAGVIAGYAIARMRAAKQKRD